MTHLSICIVNWNTASYLRECLASIEQYPPAADYEVIVVDNASSDNSVEMVDQEFPNIILIASKDNLGYAAGNNLALKKSSGEWLLLLNPDVRVLPGTLDNALSVAKSLPDFGALGIKQIGADSLIQKSVRSFPEPRGVFFELLKLSRLFPNSRTFGSYRMTWFDYSGTVEVDQPMATFLLIHRTTYDIVGGMDENFPIFFNDVDLCYRIKASGKKVFYTDQSAIVHYGGAGTAQARRDAMVRESKVSFLRFYEKHYRTAIPAPIYQLITYLVRASITLQRFGTK